MNTNTNTKSRSDAAQQFARGFAFCSNVLQQDSNGRFVLPVEFWQGDSNDAVFCSEAVCRGQQLVALLRFVGACLTGAESSWRDLRVQTHCLQITK